MNFANKKQQYMVFLYKNKTNNTQQNSKCKLCGEKDKTINYIKSEGSKLAQKKYKTRQEWVEKILSWELCKKFNLENTTGPVGWECRIHRLHF